MDFAATGAGQAQQDGARDWAAKILVAMLQLQYETSPPGSFTRKESVGRKRLSWDYDRLGELWNT
jgi:hypothetical protein